MEWTLRENKIQAIAGAAILVIVAVVPFLCWHDSRVVINPDPFTYLQHAKDVLSGKKLYTEVNFDKGPLSILTFVIPELVAPRSYSASTVFLAVCLGLQSLAFVWVFRRDLAVGLCCTLIMTVLPLTHWDWVWLGTEHASNFFITGVLIIAICISREGRFLPWQCLVAGMLTCFALNVRQTGLFVAIVPATAILCAARPLWKKMVGIGWCIAGGIAGFGIVLVWVSIISDVHSYIYRFFFYPASYAENGSWTDSVDLLTWVSATPLGWISEAALIAALLNVRSWKSNGPLVLSALVAGIISVALPRRISPHYWVGFIPYLAMIVGLGLYQIQAKWRGVILVVSVVVFCISLPNIRTLYIRASENPDTIQRQEVANAADKAAPKNSTLLVWGPMGSEAIVYASRQPEASKYWILWEWAPPRDKLLPLPLSEIYDQYLQQPPTEIIAYSKWKDLLEGEPESKDIPEIAAQFKLARLLFERFEYRFDISANGFEIGRLVGPRNKAPRPATLY